MSPRVHPLALCWPPGSAQYRGASVISLDKRANIPCSPLMSPAKRTWSTLGPLGFIYPFFLAPQRVDRGVKFVRCLRQCVCDRLTTSHSHCLSDSQRAPCCILLIHIVGFHILFTPLKRYVMTGMKQPWLLLKGFLKETFTRECSLTSTSVIEAEKTAPFFQS